MMKEIARLDKLNYEARLKLLGDSYDLMNLGLVLIQVIDIQTSLIRLLRDKIQNDSN